MRHRRVSRRSFLAGTGLGALALNGLAVEHGWTQQPSEDSIAVHNLLVIGERTIFMSHFPMFALNDAKTAFTSRHRYQIIVESTFSRPSGGTDLGDAYLKDRQNNPDRRFYSFWPNAYVISRLFTPPEICAVARSREGR